jgi:hypothetical protein
LTTHDPVSQLLQEVARIREDNRQYFARRRHRRAEEILHAAREAGLVQIQEELGALEAKFSRLGIRPA